MAKAPAFQFYPDKFLAGTAHLSPRAVGHYMRGLCWMWLHTSSQCSIPNEVHAINLAFGLTRRSYETVWRRELMPAQAPLLKEEGDVLVSNGLRKEVEKQRSFRERASTGGIGKWHDGDTDGWNRQKRSERLTAARAQGRHSKAEWVEMLEFFGNRCVRCGASGADVSIVKDHIVPIYAGGSDAISNLQPLCRSCNAS